MIFVVVAFVLAIAFWVAVVTIGGAAPTGVENLAILAFSFTISVILRLIGKILEKNALSDEKSSAILSTFGILGLFSLGFACGFATVKFTESTEGPTAGEYANVREKLDRLTATIAEQSTEVESISVETLSELATERQMLETELSQLQEDLAAREEQYVSRMDEYEDLRSILAARQVDLDFAARMTGRHFLIGGLEEEPGFALYSYLLFTRATDDRRRGQQLKCIEGFLEVFEPIVALQRYTTKEKLNEFLVPIQEPIESARPEPKEILETYDFARSQILLNRADPQINDGIFIICSRSPLTRLESKEDLVIYQDLSWIPPDMAKEWLKEFLRDAATRDDMSKPNLWADGDRKRYLVRLRTLFALVGEAFTELEPLAKEHGFPSFATAIGALIK